VEFEQYFHLWTADVSKCVNEGILKGGSNFLCVLADVLRGLILTLLAQKNFPVDPQKACFSFGHKKSFHQNGQFWTYIKNWGKMVRLSPSSPSYNKNFFWTVLDPCLERIFKNQKKSYSTHSTQQSLSSSQLSFIKLSEPKIRSLVSLNRTKFVCTGNGTGPDLDNLTLQFYL